MTPQGGIQCGDPGPPAMPEAYGSSERCNSRRALAVSAPGHPIDETPARARTSRAALFMLLLLMGQTISGCSSTSVVPPVEEAPLSQGIPRDSGLAFGRIHVEGWRKGVLGDPATNVEFRNELTQKRVTHTLEKDGEFFLFLPAGRYGITSLRSGFQQVGPSKNSAPMSFIIPPGSPVYLGTLSIRLPSGGTAASGQAAVLDEFESAVQRLGLRYPTLGMHRPPVKGLMFALPIKEMSTIVVDAILNGKLAVPLLLDTGASYTRLTRQTAHELALTATQNLPKMKFLTSGGVVESPIARLESIQVGASEVRDVDVAIDVDGHLRIGLLGMNFLRHFKITLDPEQGRVKLER